MSANANRPVVERANDARADVGEIERTPWLEGQVVLPFGQLSPDGFELLVYLLLAREHAPERVFYYGKVGDLGRDIVHVGSAGTVLVQCKRYQGRVGVEAIRTEMGKLCVNLHSGAISETFAKVAFYASTDFTAPAVDLLRAKAAWQKVAASALEAHLGEAPSRGLLDFAMNWFPDFELVDGAKLTERLRAHTDLRDEFFRVRQVVDAAPIHALTQVTQQQHADVMAALKSLSDPFGQIGDLVRKAEHENPGLEIKAEIDARGQLWRVRAKPGAGPVAAGDLRFPATEAGKRGREKFERMLDTGEEISLATDECTWTPVIQFRFDSADAPTAGSIVISPRPPNVHVPVDLSAGRAVLRNAMLHVERAGRTEAVFSFHWGEAFVVRLHARKDAGASAEVEFSFGGESPQRAIVLADFFRSAKNAPIHALDTQSGEMLLEIGGLAGPWDDANIEFVRAYASWILRINAELGTTFAFPESIERNDSDRARALATAIEKRCAVSLPAEMITITKMPKEEAEQLIARERSGAPLSVSVSLEEFRLFDEVLDVGPCSIGIPQMRPSMPLDELEALVSRMDDRDVIDIDLASPRTVYSFERWISDTVDVPRSDRSS